ncbi:hypothetical protein BGL34_02830 [Fructilactobacillus lindneri]|uniref:Prepilin peptidase n=2 Tax=Fructilactobacillus lindneri TaxID=53444 RepID=A0A0R2JNA8_9LACO|nr:A24 family peptidase [Fructilactobacillus lindneri]ANZ57917.1 hypothetical protein AYR60_03705 [Fructilactobacillus lindneri]ANZ59187.1 hypothetical protein AYR59_03705 [Fructilactobacillus lindneri]KRN78610.1 prepilin peptidase [Fructilactobacillus lindneri DSM 20690 = JCM 11027]POG98237.1 hypothetical protein BGL31_04030 [Fructilactobacillus lindneri]POH01646.1 hypothetical protein BGL32_03395 [Fructilactobacillus lindneri]
MNFYWFVFGCVIGSFLNVFVSRSLNKTNFISGRSHCDNCQKNLKWYELIPMISYIIQFGKCRNCLTNIPNYVFIFELTMGVAFLEFRPCNIINILLLIFIIILQIISTFDLLTFQFSSYWLLPLLIIALIVTNLSLLKLLTIFIIYFILLALNRRYSMLGNGDIDLMILILIVFGFTAIIHVTLIASLLALFFAIFKKQKIIPFLPFLYFGTLIVNSGGLIA